MILKRCCSNFLYGGCLRCWSWNCFWNFGRPRYVLPDWVNGTVHRLDLCREAHAAVSVCILVATITGPIHPMYALDDPWAMGSLTPPPPLLDGGAPCEFVLSNRVFRAVLLRLVAWMRRFIGWVTRVKPQAVTRPLNSTERSKPQVNKNSTEQRRRAEMSWSSSVEDVSRKKPAIRSR